MILCIFTLFKKFKGWLFTCLTEFKGQTLEVTELWVLIYFPSLLLVGNYLTSTLAEDP